MFTNGYKQRDKNYSYRVILLLADGVAVLSDSPILYIM